MNARERFHAVCRFEPADRAFRFETIGFWPETIERWHAEGLPEEVEVISAYVHFGMDLRMPIFIGGGYDPGFVPAFEEKVMEETDAYRILRTTSGSIIKEFKDRRSALPQFLEFPVKDMKTFEELKWRLDPLTPERLGNWHQSAELYNESDVPVYLYVCGLFGMARHLLGFDNLMFAYYDLPQLLHAIGEQWVKLLTGAIQQITASAKIDAIDFWEDMAYRNGPMIGPSLFREFMSPYYERVIACARSRAIEVFEVDTDGNADALIPLFLEVGVNKLLPFEVQAGMDIREIRKRYGRKLIIEGGLDKRVLALDFAAIKEEVESKVPILLRDGGYFPGIDHYVPPDVPLKNFEYFLTLVRNIGGRNA
jgi:uroporphyrinogen decarboxylase